MDNETAGDGIAAVVENLSPNDSALLCANIECKSLVQEQNSDTPVLSQLCGTCAKTGVPFAVLADPAVAKLVKRAAGLTRAACSSRIECQRCQWEAFEQERGFQRPRLDAILSPLFSCGITWCLAASTARSSALCPVSQLKFKGQRGSLVPSRRKGGKEERGKENHDEVHECIQKLDDQLVGRFQHELQELEAICLLRRKEDGFRGPFKISSADCDPDFSGLLQRITSQVGGCSFSDLLSVVQDKGMYLNIGRVYKSLVPRDITLDVIAGGWIMNESDAERVFANAFLKGWLLPRLVFNRNGTVFTYPVSCADRIAFMEGVGEDAAVRMLGDKWSGEWTYSFAGVLRRYMFSECFMVDGSPFCIEMSGDQSGRRETLISVAAAPSVILCCPPLFNSKDVFFGVKLQQSLVRSLKQLLQDQASDLPLQIRSAAERSLKTVSMDSWTPDEADRYLATCVSQLQLESNDGLPPADEVSEDNMALSPAATEAIKGQEHDSDQENCCEPDIGDKRGRKYRSPEPTPEEADRRQPLRAVSSRNGSAMHRVSAPASKGECTSAEGAAAHGPDEKTPKEESSKVEQAQLEGKAPKEESLTDPAGACANIPSQAATIQQHHDRCLAAPTQSSMFSPSQMPYCMVDCSGTAMSNQTEQRPLLLWPRPGKLQVDFMRPMLSKGGQGQILKSFSYDPKSGKWLPCVTKIFQGDQAQQSFTRETEVLDAVRTLGPVPSCLCTAIDKSSAGPEPWVAITPYMPETLQSVQDRHKDLMKRKHLPNEQLGFDLVLQALRAMRAVLDGEMALQSLGYLHLDLSSRNVLAGMGPDQEVVYTLADYGLAHKVAPGSSTGHAKFLYGTFQNWAPDYFQTGQYSEETELHALGCILCDFLCMRDGKVDGNQPRHKVLEQIRKERVALIKSDMVSKELYSKHGPVLAAVERMMAEWPGDRGSFSFWRSWAEDQLTVLDSY